MTELPEGVRAHECPNQHPVPAGGKFCPTCGEGVATAAAAPFPQAAQISATTPAFSAQFPTGPPWLLGRARFGVLALSAAALVLLTASALLSYFIGGPRLLFYVEVVAGLVLLVHRSKRLGPKEVFGLTMAAAANLVLVQALIFPALARGRGYSDRVNWGEPWGIVALFRVGVPRRGSGRAVESAATRGDQRVPATATSHIRRSARQRRHRVGPHGSCRGAASVHGLVLVQASPVLPGVSQRPAPDGLSGGSVHPVPGVHRC